jgi:hypothetical protein
MKELEIIEKHTDKTQLTLEEIFSILNEPDGTYKFLSNYKVSEDFIFENKERFNKEVVLISTNLSESFIEKSLYSKWFVDSDIKELNMQTYANLSEKFIFKYKEFINWNRMILYISTQSDTFDDYIKIIENNNLWSLISANDLPVDFIRDYKDKLDWKLLSIVKIFSDNEKLEFTDYIINFESVVGSFNEDSIAPDELNLGEWKDKFNDLSKDLKQYRPESKDGKASECIDLKEFLLEDDEDEDEDDQD